MPFSTHDDVVILTQDDTGCVQGAAATGNPHYDVLEDANQNIHPHHETALNLLPHAYSMTSNYWTKRVNAYVSGKDRVLELTVYSGGLMRPRGGRYFKDKRRSPR